MAVPKKRTGARKQATRRSHWKAIKPATTKCSHCGATVLAHTVCTECGYYKGKAVSIKSADYVEATEDKKTAKKASAKKAAAPIARHSTKYTKIKAKPPPSPTIVGNFHAVPSPIAEPAIAKI